MASRSKFNLPGFMNDMNSYDFERIADLKSMVEYQKRMIKRLQEEYKILTQTVENELQLIDSINNLFAYNRASSCCTNQQSVIYQTLSQELKPVKVISDSPQVVEPNGDLYMHPKTDDIIETMKRTYDFQEFFYDYPLGFIAFFDQGPVKFNTDKIILEAETWPTERRNDFFSAFFEHLNSIAFFFSSMLSLVDSKTVPMMSEYIETGLSTILNCSKVAFFMYDQETSELIMEKQRLQMRRQLKSGIIYESLIKNKQALVCKTFKNFSKDDAALLKNNHVLLSVPIYCDGNPAATLLLYDKIGGFRCFDYIVGDALSRFISHTIPIISQNFDRKQCIEVFQNSLDTFLQLVSAQDIASFQRVIPTTFYKHFQCEHFKIYKVSKDLQTFSQVSSDNSKHGSFPTNVGIIGQCISQKTPIRMTSPELSVSFVAAVDRPTPTTISKSLLTCPVLDKDGIVRFVIALFNKKNLASFSVIDLERLRMVCANLNNILTSVLATKKMSMIVEHSKTKVTLYTTIFEMLCELSTKETIAESIGTMMASIGTSFPGHSIDVYYVNKLNQLVCSYLNDYEDRLYTGDTDPIVTFTATSETKQAKANDDSPLIIYSGVKDTSGSPIGLIKITAGKNDTNKFSVGSMFQSTLSFVSMDSVISKAKSSVKIKLEKFNTIQASQYQNIRDESMSNLVKIWNKLFGPILELLTKKANTSFLINICDNIVDNLPITPIYAVSVFKELQYIFGSIGTDEENEFNNHPENDVFILNEFIKNDEYIHKTKSLIDSFSLLIASEHKDSKPKTMPKKNFGLSIESVSENYINNSSFDVFLGKVDIINQIMISVLSEFHILGFLGIDADLAQQMINGFQIIHSAKPFHSWDLVLDHFQFAAFLLKAIEKYVSLSIEQTTTLFIYILSLYSTPYLIDPNHYQESLIKYYIENGHGPSSLTTFVTVISSLKEQIITQDTINVLAPYLMKLENSQTFDFLFSGQYFVLIANLCQFSYLARTPELSKNWCLKRFEEECEGEEQSIRDEIMKHQLDFEVRSIILPTCGEFVKKGIKFDHIRKLFTSTVSAISGGAF